jgi:hypothetical protein
MAEEEAYGRGIGSNGEDLDVEYQKARAAQPELFKSWTP